MFRNKSVNTHQFSMIPKADVPRSAFNREYSHKTTFDSSWLVPILLDEVLPGDTFNVNMTAFARMSTPIFPIMDNLHLDSFFFFVPNRLVWDNWQKFMGEQVNPGASTSYIIPEITSPVGGYAVGSLQDYMGLPTVGQIVAGNTFKHSALFNRAYNLIFNEWFRDENLTDSLVVATDDGPDPLINYGLQRRGKRKDYFTSCLPWPQKGTAVSLPLGTSAPVVSNNVTPNFRGSVGGTDRPFNGTPVGGLNTAIFGGTALGSTTPMIYGNQSGLIADLSAATAATVNQLRQSFQIQKLLERDARGGTRYTEIVRSHFGVISPDARLQRPEYLGGGSTPVNISPISQTSGSPGAGAYTDTPLGTLSAVGTAVAKNGFRQSFTEHGMIIGLVSVRADLNYQQGLRKMWSRSSRYDFYFPAFAMLGEQAVLNKEIFCDGSATDNAVFGYQERWAEYRYFPSQITSLFRSTAASTIDGWHLAQRFVVLPTLNDSFIKESVPMSRVLAVGAAANGQQFIFDSFFNIHTVRPLPMYSVPGLIDHF